MPRDCSWCKRVNNSYKAPDGKDDIETSGLCPKCNALVYTESENVFGKDDVKKEINIFLESDMSIWEGEDKSNFDEYVIDRFEELKKEVKKEIKEKEKTDLDLNTEGSSFNKK